MHRKARRSRRLVVSCIALALIAGALASHIGGAAAGGVLRNGDANADGTVDVADVVQLLFYLFRDGPEPAAIECPPGALPATGHSQCYDSSGIEIACDDPNYPGQDASHRAGCAAAERFADNGDGTLSDRCTGLQWQKDNTFASSMLWQDALRRCDALILAMDGTWTTDPAFAAEHGGVRYDDWRLPNARELESIVDYSRAGPSVAPPFALQGAGTWTSTHYAFRPGDAWCVNFFSGRLEPVTKQTTLQVLAVRNAGG